MNLSKDHDVLRGRVLATALSGAGALIVFDVRAWRKATLYLESNGLAGGAVDGRVVVQVFHRHKQTGDVTDLAVNGLNLLGTFKDQGVTGWATSKTLLSGGATANVSDSYVVAARGDSGSMELCSPYLVVELKNTLTAWTGGVIIGELDVRA